MSAAHQQTPHHAHLSPLVIALSMALAACGGAGADTAKGDAKTGANAPAANGASTQDAEKAAANAEPPKLEFPAACAKEGSEVCVPPQSFTKHLCTAPNAASLALSLFAKGTPWVRMYVARNTEAWDPSTTGGASMKLSFDEEILILAYRPAKTGGMVINGATGTYDILRWDGACATLNADELRKYPPPDPGFSDIPWKKLDDELQQKLLTDGRVALKEGEMKKACKGLSRNQSNPTCDKAQKSLSKAIVAYARVNGTLPTPKL